MEGSSRGGGYPEALVKSYKLGKTLGIGSFGKVKVAEHILTGLRVAIKIIDRRQMKSMEMEEKGTMSPSVHDLYLLLSPSMLY
jgi:5'-AMP-activated protein kinase, catalytic alpha subunit